LTLRTPYTTLSPEFDEFLFAPIGVEPNGMALSVISALTRLNIDPWREAARLSLLSKEKAVEALAPIIARLPVGGWTAVDIPEIARRLVDVLPRQDNVIQSVATLRVSGRTRSRVVYAVMLVLLAAFYFGFVVHHQPRSDGAAAPSAPADGPHRTASGHPE
jgi:hypothetical protein